jgi:hypothetical protein
MAGHGRPKIRLSDPFGGMGWAEGRPESLPGEDQCQGSGRRSAPFRTRSLTASVPAMSCDVKAIGTLTFDSRDDLEEAFESLAEDDDDESVAEVRDLVTEGTTRKGKTLRVAIDGALTAEANVWFQDWLEEAAGAASGGHLDTWQESFGDANFVRIHAGGEEEQISGPFPGAA